jgi:hypothetical protein
MSQFQSQGLPPTAQASCRERGFHPGHDRQAGESSDKRRRVGQGAYWLYYPGEGKLLCLKKLKSRTCRGRERDTFTKELWGQKNSHHPVSKTGKVYAEIGGSRTEGIELGLDVEQGSGT